MHPRKSIHDWIEFRLEQCAKAHDLRNKLGCYIAPDIPVSFLESFQAAFGHSDEPLTVFWGGERRWTALGRKAIFGFDSGRSFSTSYAEIQAPAKALVPLGSNNKPRKELADSVSIPGCPDTYWAPAGAATFALTNILRVFPPNRPDLLAQLREW